jgi:hypothetical protein
MAAVFSPCVGAVAKIPGCSGDAVFKVDISGGSLTMPISGFALELNGNYQFLHTVNDFIYVYAFGDRIGELTVSGFGFSQTCGNASSAKICNLFDFYTQNRISRKGDLSVHIGECPDANFWAFLTGMRVEVQDPQTAIAQWSLRFNVLPKK